MRERAFFSSPSSLVTKSHFHIFVGQEGRKKKREKVPLRRQGTEISCEAGRRYLKGRKEGIKPEGGAIGGRFKKEEGEKKSGYTYCKEERERDVRLGRRWASLAHLF